MNIIHCQLRNKANNLNVGLFNHYLRTNSNCEHCASDFENTNHYFFECVKYNVQRLSFLESLNKLYLLVPISINLLLYGKSSLSYCKNIAIVHKYIISIKRFNHLCFINGAFYDIYQSK